MTFLENIFEYLNKSFPYAVLRSYEKLPYGNDSHDIDMICSEKDYMKHRVKILDIAKLSGFQLLRYYKDERFATLFFQRVENKKSEMVELDFFFGMSAKGIYMMESEKILKNRQFNGKVYHVCLIDEILDKCLCNGVFGVPYPEKYKDRLNRLTESEKNELNQKLSCVFGEKVDSFEKHQLMPENELSKLAMKEGFKRRGFSQYYFLLRHCRYLISNIISPGGVFISFTGPDGVGKTTVIDAIKNEYETVFRGSVIERHFRPEVLPRLAETMQKTGVIHEVDCNYDKPHRGNVSGKVGSFLRLMYYALDYIIGYFLKIRRELFRRRIVIFDRYYTDIIADSKRSNIGLSYKFIAFIGRFIPSPKYKILLTADSDKIVKRKQELSIEEIEAINNKLDYIKMHDDRADIFYNNDEAMSAAYDILRWICEKESKKAVRKLLKVK